MIKQLLDHGFVRLVSYMQPMIHHEFAGITAVHGEVNDSWSGDLEIVRNARVSYDADWRAGQDEGSDAKLINSMTRRHHTTPFEAMVFTFEVKAPIFVFRQWHRHRTWSYNELSMRYATPKEIEFYIPDPSMINPQHATDKQMRDLAKPLTDAEILAASMLRVCENAAIAYDEFVKHGMARELARCVLPVNTYSRMFATVDLHNLKHFLTLRQDAHAQYEIRVYADAIFDLVKQVCPLAMEAFDAQRSASNVT